jgi:hypothetical protein
MSQKNGVLDTYILFKYPLAILPVLMKNHLHCLKLIQQVGLVPVIS